MNITNTDHIYVLKCNANIDDFLTYSKIQTICSFWFTYQ